MNEKDLFDALVDLPPDEATARLAAEPNAELREKVARLLQHDRAAGENFLAPAVDQLDLTPLARRHIDVAPAKLGRFYVLRKLGAGGMGVVYAGFDEKLDRKVALKLLSVDAHEWLVREGQALGRLAHPNVVAVYEAGEDEGRPFLAMELVEGPTLRAWLESPRPFAETLRLFIEAGRGLQAAHDAGLVHRDFKPDNVLVGPDQRARVVDFGIAALGATPPPSRPPSLPAGDSALSPPLTNEGIIGTPAFMSPEQFRGQRATEKSDQFSFAVSLYRAVYCRAPFTGNTPLELSHHVLDGAISPPPKVAGVPEWLGAILTRALAGDPERRFASMAGLLAEIERRQPRDPQLDPSLTRRERLVTAAVTLGVSVPLMVIAYFRGPTAFLATHAALLRVALGFFILVSGLSFAFRRSLSKSLYGRRIIYVLVGVPAALLLHRLVCWRLGVPVLQTMGGDLVVMGSLLTVSGVIVERWVLWPGAVMLAGLAWVMVDPSKAPVALVMTGPASWAVSVYFLRRR